MEQSAVTLYFENDSRNHSGVTAALKPNCKNQLDYIGVLWRSWWFAVLSTQQSTSKDLHMLASKSYEFVTVSSAGEIFQGFSSWTQS